MTEQETSGATTNMANVGAQVGAEAQEQQGNPAPPVDHSLLTNTIAAAQKGLDLKVQQIRDDRRLTKEEQRQQISELWDRVSADYPKLLQAYEDRLTEEADKAEQDLFWVLPSSMDSVRAAYSDVYDRTAFMREAGDFQGAREELERLFERAIRTSDKALETAVGQRAMELGEEGLRERYLDRSDVKRRKWERYVEARTKQEHFADPQERLFGQLSGRFNLRKPEEA